jgi:hypothetical protein
MKLGVAIALLAVLYSFYPTYELAVRSAGDQPWQSGATHWSLARCREAGAALDEGEWRCRQNNPWHLLFRTGTRYDPAINESQRALESG